MNPMLALIICLYAFLVLSILILKPEEVNETILEEESLIDE